MNPDPKTEEPWQAFRRLCTPATSWHDENGWRQRAEEFRRILTSDQVTDTLDKPL